MRVCITAITAGADEVVDPRFGRCDHFVFVDTESDAVEREPNGLADGAGGVGAKVAQHIADRGVHAVLTGQVGPNAFRVLDAAGVTVYAAGGRSLDDSLADLRDGRLTALNGPSGPARHAGH